MADNPERPTIVIGINGSSDSVRGKLKPILNGIEEEQIPVSLEDIHVDNVVSRAYQAALSSRLSVGIAYDNHRFIVHYKNLPESKPLFDINSPSIHVSLYSLIITPILFSLHSSSILFKNVVFPEPKKPVTT